MGMLIEHESCDDCYGTRRDKHDKDPSNPTACPYCVGTGRKLTPLGRELLDLLSEHFVMTPKERW